MKRFFLFITAIVVIYVGGFVYEQIGPLLYAVTITIIASTPLLLKMSFWKKLILMVPLLVLRVIGKVFLSVFGKNALSKVLAKYGLLERRFNRVLETIATSKNQGIYRWKSMRRSSQAYLLLIFFPVALMIFFLTLIIKIVRLRFLQFIVEKLMQSYLMKLSTKLKARITSESEQLEAEFVGPKQLPSKSEAANENTHLEKVGEPNDKTHYKAGRR